LRGVAVGAGQKETAIGENKKTPKKEKTVQEKKNKIGRKNSTGTALIMLTTACEVY